MKLEGADFDAVLADAQKQGYAETPPDLDIDGWDSQHKIGILASLAHGFWVKPEKIHVEGIRHISAMDIKFAERTRLHHQAAGHHQTDCRLRHRCGEIAETENRKLPACRFRFIRHWFRTRTCWPA